MEKFFINILDVIKYLEVKAQEKPQRKKYWVLGKQYLQPVDDVDEEKKCSDYDFKRKVRCVYQAARCGMKEGMLTGIFLGGFYGLVKNLNENLSNALMPSSLIRSREEGKDQNSDKNLTENETANKNTVQSNNNNYYQPQDDFGEPTFFRDSALKNKKRGKTTFTKSEPPDRGNSNNELSVEKRPSSAGQSASGNLFPAENLRPNTVMNAENNKSKSRIREKVEIVGYAFVQTLDSRDSESSGTSARGSASEDSDKTKRDSQKEEGESESQNRSESKSRANSDRSGKSSGSTYPKNVLGSINEVHKKKKLSKKDGDRSRVEERKLSSDSSRESYPAQVLQETKSKPHMEDTKHEKKRKEEKNSKLNSQKDRKSGGQSTTSQNKQKPASDKAKIGFNKGIKKNWSKASRLNVEPTENKDSKSDIKHGDKSNKSKSRLSKFEKGNKHRKPAAAKKKVFDAFYENIFMPKKISKSILVDADVISNGYSLSLNNESLNSDEELDPMSESNFNILDASGQRISHIIGRTKAAIKDDDSVSYTQKKKLAFVEPEIFPLSDDPSMRFEPSTPSLARIKEDSSNSESVHSIGTDSESGHGSHGSKTEGLNEPGSIQSFQSFKKVLEDNQPDLGQSFGPSRRPTYVGPIPFLSGYASPKAVSIGDTTATSFDQSDDSSNRQSKEFFRDKASETEIVGTEFAVDKVRSVKESEFGSAPKSGYLLIKNVSDSVILLSACNCALVLGVLCAVVSTTKASLSF